MPSKSALKLVNEMLSYNVGIECYIILRYGGRIQLLLKRLPDSSVSSLFPAG